MRQRRQRYGNDLPVAPKWVAPLLGRRRRLDWKLRMVEFRCIIMPLDEGLTGAGYKALQKKTIFLPLADTGERNSSCPAPAQTKFLT